MNLSDEQLIESFCNGNKKAFNLLYERHVGFIANYVWRRVGGDSASVEDLTQEIFLQASRGACNFRHDSKVKTWLRKIAKHKCMDFRGKLHTRMQGRHDSIDGKLEETGQEIRDTSGMTDPAHILEQEEFREAIDGFLNKLSPKEQEAILLTEEGFSYKEIAEITNEKSGTVGSRISNARKKLLEYLNRYRGG